MKSNNIIEDIKNIKEKINFIEFVIYSGFEPTPYKNTRNGLAFIHSVTKERVWINNDKSYKSITNLDYGDIIDFVEKRLGSLYNRKVSNYDKINAVALLTEYCNLSIEEKAKKISINLPEFNKKSTKNVNFSFYSDLYNVKEINDTSYLNLRKISNKTIFSDSFKNTIFNCSFVKIDENSNKAIVNDQIVNTCFKYIDKLGTESALDIRYHDGSISYKYFAKFSNLKRSIYISNHLKTTKELFVSESPINCLSHYETYPNNNIRYCSIGGVLSYGQLELIMKIREKYNYKLILSNDFDLSGQTYNLKFVTFLIQEYHIKTQFNISDDYISILLNFRNNKEKSKLFKTLIDSANKKIKSAFSSENTLEKRDLLKESFILKQDQDLLEILIPKKALQFYFFLTGMIKIFKNNELKNVSVILPKLKDHDQYFNDWNDLLRKREEREETILDKILL